VDGNEVLVRRGLDIGQRLDDEFVGALGERQKGVTALRYTECEMRLTLTYCVILMPFIVMMGWDGMWW